MNQDAKQVKLLELAWTNNHPRRMIAVGMDTPKLHAVNVDAARWRDEAVRLDEENERLRNQIAELKSKTLLNHICDRIFA